MSEQVEIDELDKAILNEIQSHFPIVSRPYEEVGERVGAPEAEVVRRVQAMMASGVIRRIGANFTSRKLGYTSTLCAAHVAAGVAGTLRGGGQPLPRGDPQLSAPAPLQRLVHPDRRITGTAGPDSGRDLRGLRGGGPEPAGPGNLQDQGRFPGLRGIDPHRTAGQSIPIGRSISRRRIAINQHAGEPRKIKTKFYYCLRHCWLPRPSLYRCHQSSIAADTIP